jgi:hypothetical protein
MGSTTWDDLLDEFEDLIDECHTALDAGRVPEFQPMQPEEVPSATPTGEHRARFGNLLEEAADASDRLAEAMKANAQVRSEGRDRVRAHRGYASTAARGRRIATSGQ